MSLKIVLQLFSCAMFITSIVLACCGVIPLNVIFLAVGWATYIPAFKMSYKKKSIGHNRFESQKITTGRFKGKMLMAEYDVEEIEREVLQESVEAMLERVCKEVPKPTASSLAESTIRRLDEQLDPRCGCSFYDDHRKSGHDKYIKNKMILEQDEARMKLQRQKNKAKKDYKYIEDYQDYMYMLQRHHKRY